jgi:hypothetical protein
MSKQVNFYMTSDDEEEFINFIHSDRDACIFSDRIPAPEIKNLNRLPDRSMPGWFIVWLWDKENSPPPELKYIAEQRYYVVDFFKSEVIQFSRCIIDNNRLIRGRIWAEITGWDRNNPSITINKSEMFQKWFNRLSSWIKRKSTKNKVGDFLLPGAVEYERNGGVLRQTAVNKIVQIKQH